MILKRFYDEPLAHASYLVGCPGAGEAIVIDPNRDLNVYLEAAAAEGMRIVGVTETHIHADYASGSLELAERTGATLYVSDEGDADWKYAFADRRFVRLVKDGDTFGVGKIRLQVMHTPGHTPEHLSFILTDEAVSHVPCCAFTGDFIFVGDVGRPDLLERAAGVAGTMEKGGHVLFQSIQKFKALPDSMMIWPAHGAGSPCGKSLGGVPASTLGYEKLTNWALKEADENTFVQDVLAGQPDPPRYYKEMKRINKEGTAPVGPLSAPVRLGSESFAQALSEHVYIVDTRPGANLQLGFVKGAVGIPLNKSFTITAGRLLPYDQPLELIASSEADAALAKRHLAMIGLDHVRAWYGPEVLGEESIEVQEVTSITAEHLLQNLDAYTILDVRNASEVVHGMIPGAINIPLGQLDTRYAEIPTHRPVVLHCASGARSLVAITLLTRLGIEDLLNLKGGFSAYRPLL